MEDGNSGAWCMKPSKLKDFVFLKVVCFFWEREYCWFGGWWFGFLESPKMKGIVTWVYP